MPLETIYMPEEVADYLRVTIDAVEQAIAKGDLKAIRVGNYVRISESDLKTFLTGSPATTSSKPAAIAKAGFSPGKDFTFTWPDKKKEQFTNVTEGTVSYRGRTRHVRIGFTVRNSAGKPRRRSLVLVDRYATVEFVSKDTSLKGPMASIIKDRQGKQVPVGAAPPAEYASLPTGPYQQVVSGPGASNGLAVICNSDDLDVMVQHALIRYTYRQERA